MPGIVDLHLLSMLRHSLLLGETPMYDNGYRYQRTFTHHREAVQRTKAFDREYSRPASIAKLPDTSSLAAIVDNTSGQEICTGVIVTRNYLLTTVEALLAKRCNGSKGIPPLHLLSARIKVKKRSISLPLVAIIFHPDKQLALIKLADMPTRDILKTIKLAKKRPKPGQTLLINRSCHPNSIWQHTAVTSDSSQDPETCVENWIPLEMATCKDLEGLRGRPVVYKDRLVGLLVPNLTSNSSRLNLLTTAYYLDWIKQNTDYKQK